MTIRYTRPTVVRYGSVLAYTHGTANPCGTFDGAVFPPLTHKTETTPNDSVTDNGTTTNFCG